jgi:hypothetical protein
MLFLCTRLLPVQPFPQLLPPAKHTRSPKLSPPAPLALAAPNWHRPPYEGWLRPATQAMGDKTAARRLALEVGVPVVPGTNQPIESPDEAKTFAVQHGYPVRR